MKRYLNFTFLISIFTLFLFTACQNEVLEESAIDQEETLVPNSQLATVMQFAVTNDGFIDNILDQSSCFSVDLPVTIVANGITITIETLDDLEDLEDLFDEFDDDDDSLEFLFPITIIFNDYTEVVINNQDELEAFVEDCSETDIEDTIECVDFVYPITMSLYDSSFQVIDNVTFNNDEEMYIFLEDFEDDDNVIIASLNFPVSLVYTDGNTITVNNNQELQAALETAEDNCYDDQCTNEDIEMYLQECYWTIDDYPESNDLENLQFYFEQNGTLQIINGDTTQAIEGNWSMSTSNNGLPEIVISDLTAYQYLEGSWIVTECDNDEFIIEYETTAGEEIQFELERECENDLDCSAQEIALNLKECKWWMNTTLLSPNYSGPLFFNEDGSVNIGYDNGNQLTGTWEVVIGNTGVFLVLDVPGDYQPISLEWRIVECDEDTLELTHDYDELVLEQECWEDNQLGCLETIDIILCDENNDGVEVFNLYEGLVEIEECEVNNTVAVSYHTSLADAQSNVNPILSATNYTNISNPQTIYVRIEVLNNPTQFEVLEMGLYLEDCSDSLSCFETNEIVLCDDNNDGVEVFNLYEGLSDIDGCTQTNTVQVSYHETLVDAQNNTNALTSVTSYTNISSPQIVYVRVQLLNDSSQFDILEMGLILEDCSDSCSEMDVDTYLQECLWNVTSYNGSDDLSIFNFNFNSDGTLIITGDNQTIESSWSTSQTEDGVWVEFSDVNAGNIQAITGNWLVVECSDEMLHLESDNNVLILERNCD